MVDHDRLLKRARSALTLGGGQDPPDLRLLEHSLRVMAGAELIVQLPEAGDLQIDSVVLRVAALYHDAGWAVQVEAKEVAPQRVLTRPTNDVQRELAAGLVENSFSNDLPAQAVARAGEAIRRINDHDAGLPESHVVSDADNLDQIGPVGFLQNLRRDLVEGRTLRHALDTWHRQQEYHYWEARIRDGIRFESVRELAWRRLATMDPFMEALGNHLDALDLAELTGVPAGNRPTPPQATC